MQATYTVDFHTANARHEAALQSFLKATDYEDWHWIPLPGKNTQGCDLELLVNGVFYNVEIKTLAGASASGSLYPTFCVEMFTDHAQQQRTDWRDHSDYIVFINMATSTAYIYDSVMLNAYCEKQRLRPSGTGTGQYGVKNKLCSWVVCVPWETETAGLVDIVAL